MIGCNRPVARRSHHSLLGVACISSLLLLSGCSGFKQFIGMDQPGPDEFAVESRAPLTIPPDFDLRPPQPGAPRPQEASSADKARKVMDTAGPGEPGKQASFALKANATGLPATDQQQGVAPGSLASTLLGTNDSASGATLDSRETTPLKGVY